MLVLHRVRLGWLVWRMWRLELGVLAVVAAAAVLYIEFLHDYVSVPAVVVTILGTAISFFIGFMSAHSYDRWWEARKIWGALVNDSRSFGRMVVTTLSADGVAGATVEELRGVQDRLVRRHIAYLYAVKERLRGETAREHLKHLTPDEIAQLEGRGHVPNALLEQQGRAVDAAERRGFVEVIRMAQLNDMLSRFSTSMGKAERIKLTIFPGYYYTMVRMGMWVFLIFLPMTLADLVGYWGIGFAFVLGTLFNLISRASLSLLNPFEGRPTDTPMSNIVRTIEINLLEQIGEKELPEPTQPVNGRYLL